jgi:hypothetical protein
MPTPLRVPPNLIDRSISARKSRCHLKTHHRFERMRLRGLSGARDELHLAAIVQNLISPTMSSCILPNRSVPLRQTGHPQIIERRSRYRPDQAGINRSAFAADQALFNAALQDHFKDAPQEIALAETAMPVLPRRWNERAHGRQARTHRGHLSIPRIRMWPEALLVPRGRYDHSARPPAS